MQAILDLTSLSLSRSPKHLSMSTIEELSNRYFHIRDLPIRLYKLPVIDRGIKTVEYSRNNPAESAVKVYEEKGLPVYIGYFVYRNNSKWEMFQHVFNVDKKGRVHEHCDIDWDKQFYYLGMPVPKEDLKNTQFVFEFSSISYIEQHSRRGLFDIRSKLDVDKNKL